MFLFTNICCWKSSKATNLIFIILLLKIFIYWSFMFHTFILYFLHIGSLTSSDDVSSGTVSNHISTTKIIKVWLFFFLINLLVILKFLTLRFTEFPGYLILINLKAFSNSDIIILYYKSKWINLKQIVEYTIKCCRFLLYFIFLD